MAINNYLSGAKVKFPVPFYIGGSAPLDARLVVSTPDQLNINNFVLNGDSFWYPGMIVGCASDGSAYVVNQNGEFIKLGTGSIDSSVLENYLKKEDAVNLFSYAGSKNNVFSLDTAGADYVGKVYNIKEKFTISEPKLGEDGHPIVLIDKETRERYLDTEINSYPAGTSVVCYKLEWSYESDEAQTDEQGNPVYKLDGDGQKIPVLDAEGNPTEEFETVKKVVHKTEYRWDALGGMHGIDWINVPNT